MGACCSVCKVHFGASYIIYLSAESKLGKLIIKAAWRTSGFDSCLVSVHCNNPVPSIVERDACHGDCHAIFTSRKNLERKSDMIFSTSVLLKYMFLVLNTVPEETKTALTEPNHAESI